MGQVLHHQNTPSASSVTRLPGWGQEGRHSWEQPWLEDHKSLPVRITKMPDWMGWGARGIAWGHLNLWHPLASLAMDAFDIELKATALQGEIKGWEKRKDHLFFSSFFLFLFFFKSTEGKEAPWQRQTYRAGCSVVAGPC